MSVRLHTWASGKAWMVDITFTHADGRVQRVKKFCPVDTRRGAEQYEREIRNALLAGTWGKQRKEIPTFEAFAVRWMEDCGNRNKESTLKAKRDILHCHLLPAFGEYRLNEITRSMIDALVTKMLKTLGKKTVNNTLTALHNLLDLAHEWGELPELPVIKWMKPPKPGFDFLTFDEADQLENTAELGRYRTMITLALNTGLRIGEMAGLQWADISLTQGKLQVRRRVYRGRLDTPKGGKEREIPLNEKAIIALHYWGKTRQLHEPWVFPQRNGGFIRNPQHACSEAIQRQALRAGLRPMGWHVLRHTFASHLAMRGVSLKVIQELLGHATIDMTMRYAHLSPAVCKDAVRTLEQKDEPKNPGSAESK